MSPDLVKSTLFSAGIHLFLLVPVAFRSGPVHPVKTDVIRGMSSLELEWVDPEIQTQGEEDLPLLRSQPSASSLPEEGAIARWEATALKNPAPRYPQEARIRGWQGTVFLQAWVTPSGEVASVRVSQGSGHPLLDGAALTALRRWRFIPARRGRRAVASVVEVPVSFRLEK